MHAQNLQNRSIATKLDGHNSVLSSIAAAYNRPGFGVSTFGFDTAWLMHLLLYFFLVVLVVAFLWSRYNRK